MPRGPHVHAKHEPEVGQCPGVESELAEDHTTRKVPEYLIALAKSLEDDLVMRSHTTLPMWDDTASIAPPWRRPPVAANDHVASTTSSTRRGNATRVAISRSIASGTLALFAVFVLFVVGARPLVVVQSAPRTPATAHARADRSDPSGTARAPRPAVAHASRARRFEWRRPPARLAKGPAGRIIRTPPY